MLLTGIPNQCVQKQLDDLCVATPPHQHELMKTFVKTHRAICQRVGVKLAPETDKEKAFSCETRGTVLGVIYDSISWSWNLDSEKIKILLHLLYDMVNSSSVANGDAMTVSGKIAHYAPLFPGSKWWKKPITSLPDHESHKKKVLQIPPLTRKAIRWWIISINRLRLGNLPIKDPLALFPSPSITVYTDASGVHNDRNRLKRGGGVFLPSNLLVRIIWPSRKSWITRFGHSTTLLESIACLQGLISAIMQHGRSTFVIHCDNAGTCASFRKGSSKCHYNWTILKAMDDVASGTMSLVSITKTRRCSGVGEIIADTIAKGCIGDLSTNYMPSPIWLRPSRVLCDWISNPTITSSLGHDLLQEISCVMDIVIPTTCLEAMETGSEVK